MSGSYYITATERFLASNRDGCFLRIEAIGFDNAPVPDSVNIGLYNDAMIQEMADALNAIWRKHKAKPATPPSLTDEATADAAVAETEAGKEAAE